MQLPFHQKIIRIATYLLAGIMVLGALLDSLANAISLMTPTIALSGTALIIVLWLAVNLILHAHPIHWIAGRRQIRLRRLGVKPMAFSVGMIALLWIPSGVALVQPKSSPPEKLPVVQKNEDKFRQKSRKLSTEQRAHFIKVINSLETPRESVILICEIGSEEACVFAGRLFELMEEANWTIVGNKVERNTLYKPVGGVALMRRGATLGEPPLGSGVLAQQTPSLMTIERAFSEIGIETEQFAVDQMPEGVIGIFVGPDY